MFFSNNTHVPITAIRRVAKDFKLKEITLEEFEYFSSKNLVDSWLLKLKRAMFHIPSSIG